MKRTLSIGVCVLLSLALVTFGLIYGTIKGFAEDRKQVDALLYGESGLMTVLEYRGADGLNLCVVARRHLSGDADVDALETAAKSLRNQNGSLFEKRQADDRLSAAAARVAEKLEGNAGFQQSVRDKAYLDLLRTDMEQLSQNAMITAYNEAAVDFNDQLAAPISGVLADILGVKPCEVYLAPDAV